MMTLDTISLSGIAPSSITSDARMYAAMEAVDPELRAAAAVREVPVVLPRIESLSSDQLDHLARWFDAPAWSDSWQISMKRSVMTTVVSIKRMQGTLAAVRACLETIGATSSVTEWWQTTPQGTPHTFSVHVTMADEVTDESQHTVRALIDAAKPVRSQYTLTVDTALRGEGGGVGRARAVSAARLSNF